MAANSGSACKYRVHSNEGAVILIITYLGEGTRRGEKGKKPKKIFISLANLQRCSCPGTGHPSGRSGLQIWASTWVQTSSSCIGETAPVAAKISLKAKLGPMLLPSGCLCGAEPAENKESVSRGCKGFARCLEGASRLGGVSAAPHVSPRGSSDTSGVCNVMRAEATVLYSTNLPFPRECREKWLRT